MARRSGLAGRGRRRVVHILLLVVLPALVFANTLGNDHHLDDIYRVRDNPEIERFWPPWRHFLDPLTGTTTPQLLAYRPLMPLSHSIDVALAERLGVDRKFIFHAVNVIAHLGTTVLLYLLFSQLLEHWSRHQTIRERSRDVAFAAALLFAVHPVSGAAVNYIGARDLLLMMLLFTAALNVYVRMRRQGDATFAWVMVLVLLALSLLAKLNSAVAFVLVLLFELVLAKAVSRSWRPWARVAAVAAVPGAYLVWTRWGLGFSETAGLDQAIEPTVYGLTQLKVHLFHYMKNLVWPFEMRALPLIEPVREISDWQALSGGAFVAASLALAWWLRRRSPIVAFAIATYWVLLALTSTVFPLHTLARDHRLYASLAFLSLGLVVAVFALPRPRLAGAFVAVLAIYFGGASISLNRVWQNEESFWAQSVRYGGTAMAHANYGLSIGAKDPALAEHHFREAMRLFPGHVYARINLGMLYIGQGRGEQGLALVEEAAELKPDWAVTHYWRSRALAALGRTGQALVALRQAADTAPREIRYQYEAARAVQIAGDPKASRAYLDRLAATAPTYEDTLFLLAFAQQASGETGAAIATYGRFIRDHPDHAQARFNLGVALRTMGHCDRAVSEFERVLEQAPEMIAAHLHAAICFRTLGDEAAAAKHISQYSQRAR
jgi:tetratricopeptide (TPR) repeat protein